eukprot:SAG22_NODE_260_length_13403_cov_57.915589_3_plen_195_part_00
MLHAAWRVVLCSPPTDHHHYHRHRVTTVCLLTEIVVSPSPPPCPPPFRRPHARADRARLLDAGLGRWPGPRLLGAGRLVLRGHRPERQRGKAAAGLPDADPVGVRPALRRCVLVGGGRRRRRWRRRRRRRRRRTGRCTAVRERERESARARAAVLSRQEQEHERRWITVDVQSSITISRGRQYCSCLMRRQRAQ